MGANLKKLIFLALFSLIFLLPGIIPAQTNQIESNKSTDFEIILDAPSPPVKNKNFFIAPVAEASYYGLNRPAVGTGVAFGYGSGLAYGFNFLYALNFEEYSFVETLIFLRYFFFGSGANSGANTGPFVQFSAGPVFFSGSGTISAGLSAGWRFPLGTQYYIEAAVKGGYPYLAGAGVSAGIRF
jgi:hypothetical protein